MARNSLFNLNQSHVCRLIRSSEWLIMCNHTVWKWQGQCAKKWEMFIELKINASFINLSLSRVWTSAYTYINFKWFYFIASKNYVPSRKLTVTKSPWIFIETTENYILLAFVAHFHTLRKSNAHKLHSTTCHYSFVSLSLSLLLCLALHIYIKCSLYNNVYTVLAIKLQISRLHAVNIILSVHFL